MKCYLNDTHVPKNQLVHNLKPYKYTIQLQKYAENLQKPNFFPYFCKENVFKCKNKAFWGQKSI
jgi:hypothetical protein